MSAHRSVPSPECTTPLVHTTDGDRFVVIASKGGAPTNPAWFHNIKANPRVTVEVGDERFEADAEIYEDKTDRVIPVVALTPV